MGLVDENGVQSRQYTAYAPAKHAIAPWGFSSKREIDGLVYFGKRFYSPTLARWITPDPIYFEDGPNLYAFVKNNPLTHFDPYGLFSHEVCDIDMEFPFYGDIIANQTMNGICLGMYQSAETAFSICAKNAIAPSYFRMIKGENFVDISSELFQNSGWGMVADSCNCRPQTFEQQVHVLQEASQIAAGYALGVCVGKVVGCVGKIGGQYANKFFTSKQGLSKIAVDKGVQKTIKQTHDVIHVTPQGVAIPPNAKYQIPNHYIENINRPSSYGEYMNGKFIEKLRIDPATLPGMKGPNYSHYHLNGKSTHYSPLPGSPDPGFMP